MESIWLRPERAGIGRPAGRSRAEITTAAVALADRDGLDAVSMHAVAREIGTRAPSLYRYVESRDELLDLMADHVVGEFEVGRPTGNWVADLTRYGLAVRALHRAHPWLAELTVTRPRMGPHAADTLEFALAALAGHPASDDAKLVAIAMVNALVAAWVINERGDPDPGHAARYLAHLATAGAHPHIAALDLSSSDPTRDRLPDVLGPVLRGLLPDVSTPGAAPEASG